MTENELGTMVVTSAIKVHSVLGPGLLESAYQRCLAYELSRRGAAVRTEVPIPIRYEDLRVENGYRVDLLINDLVAVELKTVQEVLTVHRSQLLSY